MKSKNYEEVACDFLDWLVGLGYLDTEDIIEMENEVVKDFLVLETETPKLFNLLKNITDK